MGVITISRVLGSDGAAIAQRVADTLSFQLVTKRILEKILEQYGLVHLDKLYQSPPRLWGLFDEDNQNIVSMLNRTMLGIAKRGNAVILGRGGYAALSGQANALHVRIQAPFNVRIKRLLGRDGSQDIVAVEELIRVNDKARSIFVQGFYDIDFNDARQFHMVLDTSCITIESATKWVVGAAEALFQSSEVDHAQSGIEDDPILQETIANILDSG